MTRRLWEEPLALVACGKVASACQGGMEEWEEWAETGLLGEAAEEG